MHMHSKWSLKVPRACSYTLGRGGQAVGPGYHEKVPQEANPSFPDVPRLSENVGKCWNHLGGGDLRILGLIHISSITDDLAIFISDIPRSNMKYQILVHPSYFPTVFVGEHIGWGQDIPWWNTKYFSIPTMLSCRFCWGTYWGKDTKIRHEIPNNAWNIQEYTSALPSPTIYKYLNPICLF